MKFFNTFNRGNGRYTTQEWSSEEMFNYDLFVIILIFIIGSILAVLASTICLIAKLWDFEANEKAPSIWGVLFSGYFVLDYHKQWIISSILKLFEDKWVIDIMINGNLALCITHLFLLIFGNVIFYNIKDKSSKKSILILSTFIVLIISFLISKSFIWI